MHCSNIKYVFETYFESCTAILRFQKHVEGTAVLPSDLKSAVFNMAMANGDETTFDQLVKVQTVWFIDVCLLKQ